MRLKRIALAAIPLLAATLIAWPFGFPVLVVFLGAVLSYLMYQYWDAGYAAGEKVYRIFRPSVHIIEEKLPPSAEREQTPPPQPMTRGTRDAEPVTGNFREPVDPSAPTEQLDPDPEPSPVVAPDPEDEPPAPSFIIGKTEPSRPGAGDGRTIELDEISSLGVGGVPGSGKTVSMVGLCAQAVVKYEGNVRFLLVDPHMHSGSPDALSARMAPLAPFYLDVPNLPNPVSGGGDLLKWMKWMTSQAKDRIGGRVPKDQQLKFVLVADEFTALLDDPEIADPLTALLLLINEQARKVGMFALVASPQWKSSRVQGTEVRNTIASFLIHNMPPAIARMLIPVAEAERSNTLAKGQAIFSSFGQVDVVRVPFMTPQEIIKCVKPYLPQAKPNPSGLERTEEAIAAESPVSEPSIAEVRAIWETYMVLNRDLSYSEDSAIRALAIDAYPGDPRGQEKVRRALKLGEEHL